MFATIGKTFRFEAAHHLPGHDGKCRQPHGHSYKVEVTFQGDVQTEGPKQGMVVDFGDVSAFWKSNLEPRVDHRDLNQSLPVFPTTAEMIAGYLLDQFAAVFPQVVAVRVWETATSFAEVSR